MAQGVLGKVREHLGEQLAVSIDDNIGLDAGVEALFFILGHRREGLEHVFGDTAQIGVREAGSASACFDLGDAQHGLESLQNSVGILDRRIDGGLVFCRATGLDTRCFQTLAQSTERRSQIMRNVAGHVPKTFHQLLDACEHAIEAFGQPAELVVGTDDGDAPGKIAVNDCARRAIDRIDPPQQQHADNDSTTEGECHRHGERDAEGADDQRTALAQIPGIVGDEHIGVLIEPLAAPAKHTLVVVRAIGWRRQQDFLPVRARLNRRQVACDHIAGAIPHQEVNPAIGLFLHVLTNEPDHGSAAVLFQVVPQDLDLLLDTLLEVAFEQREHGPVDHSEQNTHHQRREGGKGERVAHGSRTRQLEKLHGRSVPCP